MLRGRLAITARHSMLAASALPRCQRRYSSTVTHSEPVVPLTVPAAIHNMSKISNKESGVAHPTLPWQPAIEYTNFSETLTARRIVEQYGPLVVPGTIAAFVETSGKKEMVAALPRDATNPASGNGAVPITTTGDSGDAAAPHGIELVPVSVRIGGRVVAVRDMGKIVFVTIRSDGQLIQLGANVTDEFFPSKQLLRAAITDKLTTGDIIGAEGTVGRTKMGELTVYVRSLSVLAPYVCADMSVCPDQRTFVAKPPKAGNSPAHESVKNASPASEEGKLSKRERKKLKKTLQAGKDADKTEASAADKTVVKVQIPDQAKAEATSTTSPDSLSPVVSKTSHINDPDLKYRYRFVDLLSRPHGAEVFRLRHKVISSLRNFLDSRDFTEVETPMFHTIPCGANAKPFMTHHNSNNSDLYLRIAPELYLKQCVVGGLERVYEIGKVFRNEDTDKSHNPEFTSCEFYAAYKTYIDLMGWTEELLRHIALTATGSTILKLPVAVSSINNCADEPPQPAFIEVDLSRPFKRVSVLDEIERKAGVMFPPINELNSSFGIAFMAALMLKHDIAAPSVRTPAKFLDKLIDHFLTDNTTEPIFVCDHPLFMSPLAKEHEWQSAKGMKPSNLSGGYDIDDTSSTIHEELNALFNVSAFSTAAVTTPKSFPTFRERHGSKGLSERFELFINGMEICNAYSELCDPNEQLKRFEQQMQAKELGDDEAMELDETFLKALQVGLPPTAGWGMGIDRLLMLLSGHASIRDVILFPLLKPQNDAGNRRRSKTAGFFGFNPNMTLFALSSLEAELKRRGDRAGCEQLLQTKRIVQQTGKDPQQHRQQLMFELERALRAQREQFCWLHGDDNLQLSNGKSATSDPTDGSEVVSWPPISASGLASLMGYESVGSEPGNPKENGKPPTSYKTTASVSSSSTTDSHVTTTTTTTTTIVAPRGGSLVPTDAWGKARRMAYRHNPVWKYMVRVMGRNTD